MRARACVCVCDLYGLWSLGVWSGDLSSGFFCPGDFFKGTFFPHIAKNR